jgi:hypothetical protein
MERRNRWQKIYYKINISQDKYFSSISEASDAVGTESSVLHSAGWKFSQAGSSTLTAQ